MKILAILSTGLNLYRETDDKFSEVSHTAVVRQEFDFFLALL